jgi:hypothetical protein
MTGWELVAGFCILAVVWTVMRQITHTVVVNEFWLLVGKKYELYDIEHSFGTGRYLSQKQKVS